MPKSAKLCVQKMADQIGMSVETENEVKGIVSAL